MKKNVLKLAGIISLLFIGSSYATPVHLSNETRYPVRANIGYLGLFCNNDYNVQIAPGKTNSASEARACLIHKITASVTVPGDKPGTTKTVAANPYKSSGTGLRQFKIFENHNGSFSIVNID